MNKEEMTITLILFLVVTQELTQPLMEVENRFSFTTTLSFHGRIFDVSHKLYSKMGFSWTPIRKSSFLNTLCTHMKQIKPFLLKLKNSNALSLNNSITLLYDVLPNGTSVSSTSQLTNSISHCTCLIDTNTNDAYLVITEDCSKHSLVNLIDILEEVGCKNIYSVVKKESKEQMKMWSQSLVTLGFEVVHPNVKSVDGFLLFGMEL